MFRLCASPVFRLFLSCLLLFSALALPVSAAAAVPISPAMSVLEATLSLEKCGLVGNDLSLSAADFDAAILLAEEPLAVVTAVTVETLPDAAWGTLYLDGTAVTVGETVPRSALDRLTFVPTPDTPTTATFTVFVESRTGNYRMPCTLSFLPSLNLAPSADSKEETVSTYQSVLCFGQVSGNDPEGDELTFELLESPRKGLLLLSEDGEYRYLPLGNFTGKDSFVYRCVDRYGNCSEPSTVTLQVDKNRSGIVYSDLTGHRAAVAAIALAERGLFIGQSVDGRYLFCPDETVTKAEFTALLLKAAGIEGGNGDLSAFADEDSVPSLYAPYVQAALELGYLSPVRQNGSLLLEGEEELTEDKAMKLLTAVSGLTSDHLLTVGNFSNGEETGEDGNPCDGSQLLTRGIAAMLLYSYLTQN